MQFIEGGPLKAALKAAHEKLKLHKEEVNDLNVFPVPDGDTGSNMSMTMESAMEFIDRPNVVSVSQVAKALGSGTLMGARGNSGVIFSQLCRGGAEAIQEADRLDVILLAKVFEGARAKAYKAVMKPTEGTILTVARALAEYGSRNAGQSRIEVFLKGALQQAVLTLSKTPDMLPELKEAGVVDAGGMGLVYLLAGFSEAICGENFDDLIASASSLQGSREISSFEATSHALSDLPYLVKAQLTDSEAEKLKKHLNHHGRLESLEARGGRFEVVVATEDPAGLLTSILRWATLLEIHLLNVHEQVAEEAPVEERPKKERSKVAFVAVSLGAGFEEIFHQLMVDEIVSGGQTMNPSTKDLFDAVERANADTVYLLPNNKNIILSAQQVVDLLPGQVVVIPSRTIPEGITALLNYDDSLTAEENQAIMTESLSKVTTGQVTYAVRDSSVDGLEIAKNDWIGLIDGKIVAKGANELTVLLALLDRSVKKDSNLLTIYLGAEADPTDEMILSKELAHRFPDLEREITSGGQPTYRYIFSLE